MLTVKENNERELVLTRILNAPRELVWQACTEQEHIAAWWGPKGFTNPVCQWVAEAGNELLIHMKGPDGNVYPMGGKFIELVKPERLVFMSTALGQDGKPMFEINNTVTFTEEGNKTKLTLVARVAKITPAAEGPLSGMTMGWNQSLDKLEAYLPTI